MQLKLSSYSIKFCYFSLFLYLVPKIRLQYRNAGKIEIEDGSAWRSVDVENWDRNHQKLLCQHLGFQEDDDFRHKSIKNGTKIATGDLICYKTQSGGGGTSCCAYLERSTTTSKTSIPNARCKYKLQIG